MNKFTLNLLVFDKAAMSKDYPDAFRDWKERRAQFPTGYDVVFIDLQSMRYEMKISDIIDFIKQINPKKYLFLCEDGPVTSAKQVKRAWRRPEATKVGNLNEDEILAEIDLDHEENKVKKMREVLSQLVNELSDGLTIIYDHAGYPGEGDYKIPRAYRTFLTSVHYQEHLSYALFTDDSDSVLTTLGLHEENTIVCSFSGQQYDIGARVEDLLERWGVRKDDKVARMRRLDDLRGLYFMLKNDFVNYRLAGLSTLENVYYDTVRQRKDYLINGNHWNSQFLKAFLINLQWELPRSGKSNTKAQCHKFFEYLSWALYMFNGIVVDWDWSYEDCVQMYPESLLQYIDDFDQVAFRDDSGNKENMREVPAPPGAVLLAQLNWRSDIPVLMKDEVLELTQGLFKYDDRNPSLLGRRISLVEYMQGYKRLVHDELKKIAPSIDRQSNMAPYRYRKGVPEKQGCLLKGNIDIIEERLTPKTGEVLLFQGHAQGLFVKKSETGSYLVKVLNYEVKDCSSLITGEELSADDVREILNSLNTATVTRTKVDCSRGHFSRSIEGIRSDDKEIDFKKPVISLYPYAFGLVGYALTDSKEVVFVTSEKQKKAVSKADIFTSIPGDETAIKIPREYIRQYVPYAEPPLPEK